VPTVLITNASGIRAASCCTAFQPVQCAGTRTEGESSASASTVGPQRRSVPTSGSSSSALVELLRSLIFGGELTLLPGARVPLRDSGERSVETAARGLVVAPDVAAVAEVDTPYRYQLYALGYSSRKERYARDGDVSRPGNDLRPL
jgi:hypothetical protein